MAGETTTTSTTTTNNTPPWHQGVDADLLGAWQNKGYDLTDPAKVAVETGKAWREAERMVGVPKEQLLRLPANAQDAAAWRGVYERLGAPKEAKDYDFTSVKYNGTQDLEPSFVDALRSAFHTRGVSKDAATDITKAVVNFLNSEDTREATEAAARKTAQLAALDAKWGTQKDANYLTALNGARRLGLSKEQMQGIEAAIGYDVAAELFRKIGAGTNEDTFVDGGAKTGQPATSEAAQARLNDLKSDPDWMKRYLSGSEKEKREFKSLIEQITGISEAQELARLTA
jgi:hypothetical protein